MTGDCPPKDNSVPFGGEFRDDYLSYTNKEQDIFAVHIFLILFFVGIGIGAAIYECRRGDVFFFDKNYIFNIFFGFTTFGLIIDLLIIIFGNCEEYYRLDKNGLYYEYKKLIWRTRNTIPLNTIQSFVLNFRIIKNDDENKKDDVSQTVYYFVNIVTQKKTFKILELAEDKKIIPEWFAFAANTVLANLTGRDLEASIVSDVHSSASNDKPSNVFEDPSALQTQTHSRSSFKPLDNTFLVPPDCELREDYLSYLQNDPRCYSISYAILFAFLAITSIGYFLGFFSINDKDFFSIGLTIILVYVSCLAAFFYCCYRIKETGSLDINGFHYEKRSIFSRSTKYIPLNSIQEFRSGTQTSNTRENSKLIKFVEIVVSDDSIRILTENDDAFREWLVDSGNAILANLKSKALEIQKAETPSDDYIDVHEFKDILNRNIDN